MFRLTRLTFCCDGCSVTEDVTSLKVIIILHGIFFFLLLFHRLADDEALIILQQTSLFLVLPYAVDNCMPLSSKSFLTLSIHLFLGLPLLLSPLTCQCSAAFGSLFPSILSTCPNHVSLLLLIFSITVSSAPSSSFVFSEDGRCTQYIRRVGLGCAAFGKLDKMWRTRSISLKTKMKLY